MWWTAGVPDVVPAGEAETILRAITLRASKAQMAGALVVPELGVPRAGKTNDFPL